MDRSYSSGSASLLAAVAFCILCTAGIADANAMPVTEDSDPKVATHAHWEHLVRRAANTWNDPDYEDDTAHIVNVQEYYKNVFSEPWSGYTDFSEVSPEHHRITSANLQGSYGPHTKPIKGRYIVMFSSSTDDEYVLDKTIEILELANYKSNQRLRATDIVPFRNVRKGFTATLNSKTLELVCVYLHLDRYRYSGSYMVVLVPRKSV